MGLAGASESHWAAGYNSSYAAASYAAASSFAYGGSSATGATAGELSAGQQQGQDTPSAANSQLPTGNNVVSFRKQILNGNIVNCKTYAVLVGVLLRSHSKSKETSVILWLYDFFWQFEQFYSIITVVANATTKHTHALLQ